MFLEGQIIEFLDADQLRPGYVRKQERDRLQVIDPRGRHLSVNGDRVAIVHGPSRENEFPTTAKRILDRVHERQAEVDVALLWESLTNGPREFQPAELAEVFFAESTPEAASAVFHALCEDTLFFRRNGLRFVPKTAEQVSNEQTRRTRQREREESREKLSATMKRLVRQATPPDADLDAVLDRVQSWLRYKTGDEIETILEEIVGAGRARDAAYDILVRSGRLGDDSDRFLVIAGVDQTYGPEVLRAADALSPVTYTDDRVDFRDLHAMTIDDDDTLEVDDALTLRRSGDDFYVGIHIADASAFVTPGDALDSEAFRRASTIYLPTTAVRMLPERISTDLASLRVGVDRPTLSVEIRFDSAFNIVEHRIVYGMIHVRERLTYEEVDERIGRGDPELSVLHQIAVKLRDARSDGGAITFRRQELKIRVYQNGGRIMVSRLDANAPSRILVSELMILLNSIAASFAATHALPVIFRTQEPRDALPPETSQLPEALAFEKLRRTFKRSRLSLTPGLHSGLGLSAYTQVSSPIRRYADLVTQRQFAAMLQNKAIPHTPDELLRVIAAAEAAESEIRSLEERSTTYWLLKYLAHEKMGVVMNATVLDKKGTVELEDYYVRGKLIDPGTAEPGSVVQVTIDGIDPLRSEIRFKRS
jgi:exoribonuclease II